MKKRYFIIPILIMLIVSTVLLIHKKDKGINSHIAVMCSGTEYTEAENIGYLKIVFDDEKKSPKTIMVKDEELKKELSNSNIEDIIGAQIFLHLPNDVIKENHIDTNTFEPTNLLLSTSEYDKYYEIVDVSYK